MAYQANILSQILKEINRYDFKKQVSKYNGDYKTHKLSCFSILAVMIYTHIKSNITLRGIVTGLGLMLSSFFHLVVLASRPKLSYHLIENSNLTFILFEFYFAIFSFFFINFLHFSFFDTQGYV